MTKVKEKRAHGHRWLEVADSPGSRSYEKCYLNGCKARRPVPDCAQAGASIERVLMCSPRCICARRTQEPRVK